MTGDGCRLVAQVIGEDLWCLEALKAVRSLELPDWAIGAGFVRNRVWDVLHAHARATPLDDIDVLYFDGTEASPERDRLIEQRLAGLLPDRPWSVRNQARMHLRNRDRPYRDTLDAMGHWLETATCVAVRLTADNALEVLAPFGVSDLVSLRSGPTPSGRCKHDQYLARMRAKNWPATWPRVQVDGLNPRSSGFA